MYHFLQFRSDKKEAWRFHDERQLSSLEKAPAFMTVLAVDQDPEILAENGEDPIDHVKYYGPMYWDFDGVELDPVLDDARVVIQWLHTNLNISKEFIHCWLSGQKGVHITVPPTVFGIKSATRALPFTYKEIANQKPVESLDQGVYSCGRGRMWRCEGVPRPKTGTFKVGVTFDELMGMDEEQYQVLVAAARPPLGNPVPASNVIFPKAEAVAKMAKTLAAKRLRALKNAEVVPTEKLREIEGVPGCIEKLITEGDNAESNWNQAAMQVAAYVAAKYDRADKDLYESEIVEPFVRNIESSSRPTVADRKSHMRDQLSRAYSGRTKFSMGPLVATMGAPCGNCPLCRADISADGGEVVEGTYCDLTKIKSTPQGYFLVGENSMRNLTTFTFTPLREVRELEETDAGRRESQRVALMGTLTDDTGTQFHDFMFPEGAWGSRRELISTVKGYGTSTVNCTDAEIQKMLRAIMNFAGAELEKMTRTPVCGVILEDIKGGNVIPHYVEATGSFTQHDVPTRYKFSGDENLSPKLFEEDYPYVDDLELEQVIEYICNMNDPHVIAPILGWTVACHFREHIQRETNQFPLLNLSGNNSTGKSTTAFLLLHLGGLDYGRTDFINVEVSSFYPLVQFVTSSTTVPRLVEEVNPTNLSDRDYRKILGLLKASWNQAAVPRGYIGAGREIRVSKDKVSSPIVFTSEQAPIVPSLKSRTIEVKFTTKALKANPEYVRAYQQANMRRTALFRLAKALVTTSLNTSTRDLMAMLYESGKRVPDSIGPRPKFSLQVALTGLEILARVMDDCAVKGSDTIRDLSEKYQKNLETNYVAMEKEKSVSEIDRVLVMMDLMASEPDDRSSGLRAGEHYWRQGNQLYLDLQPCVARYCRFANSSGDRPVVRETRQMVGLLDGEAYYLREETHPLKEGVQVHVIDLKELREKGTTLSNFRDGTEPEQ